MLPVSVMVCLHDQLAWCWAAGTEALAGNLPLLHDIEDNLHPQLSLNLLL
jgi:hypothetical protein